MRSIFLVDDEPLILAHTRTLLNWEEMRMEIVGEASSGIEAIPLIERLAPDAVITDLVMPGMNGLEMIEALGSRCKSRFVVLTGYQDFSFMQTAIRAGVVDYLLKPPSPQELLGALTRLFGDEERDTDYEKQYGSIIAKVIDCIDESLTDAQLTLQWICRNKLYMNETYVGRLFQQRTGLRFNAYLNMRRIKRAKQLMDERRAVPLTELAEQTGFLSTKYLIEVFKKQEGITPGQYMRSL